MKTAIVCEGGGMRGVFTSGVLQSFMEKGFIADALVGVSAGASNGCSYVSGQQGRGLRTNVEYIDDKRYLSVGNFLRTGSIFGMDFVFGELPNQLDPFDYKAFLASPCNFYAGATDLATGAVHFFEKTEIDQDWMAIRASCSLPLLSNIVEIGGRKYLDGGIADPIPVNKALALGAEKLVVVLTRERGYKKQPQGLRWWYATKYREYPAFVRAMDLRHEIYNHTLAELEQLEAEGRAVIIAPPAPLAVDRFGKDKAKLCAAYEVGKHCGFAALANI